jgi:protoporphyrinogen oxidase
MPDNWAYFPDREIIFGRITEMKNFSESMCPPGKTSLFIEFFCFEGDAIWNATQEELYDRSMEILTKIDLLTKDDVTSVHLFRQSAVYPVYDLEYETHIQTIMQWLDSFQNLYAVGRPGRFRYTNQDHSLEMGILAAQSILGGKRLDIESPGAEKEYFERGFVPTARG